MNSVVKKFRKNIFNELDYLDTELYTLKLGESEKVDKKDCYKVRATCVNGTIRLLYYDKQTFLQLREDKATSETGGVSSTYFSNFKKFGALTYYSSVMFAEGKKMQKAFDQQKGQ